MRRIALVFLLGLIMMPLIISAVVAKGEDELVPLSTGCNAVVWTGENNTDIQIIVDSIKLPQALIVAWKFEPATRHWHGFAPFVFHSVLPEGTYNFSLNRFDVVFLCVDGPTWWYRPALDDPVSP